MATYWERRYARGRGSGDGSQGRKARIKARRINTVIATHGVRSVVDWGCGDGEVLAHLDPVDAYAGVDVSPTILERVSRRFPGRVFYLDDTDTTADLALSIDVLHHFPDDDAGYHTYLGRVFRSAERLVLIHSTNRDRPSNRHVCHRTVVDDIRARFPGWQLTGRWPGVNTCEFFLWGRQ